jgi:hypothetical protein
MVIFLILDNVPKSKLEALDALAIRFHKSHRHTIRRTFPATNFCQGITNSSKISTAKRLGLVFLFVILAHYDEGWQFLHSTFEAHKAKAARDDESSTVEVPPVDLPAVLSVFEAMFCFDQWLNQTTYWTMQHHAVSKVVVQRAIQTLMSVCVNDIPLSMSKSWKFPKFHKLLHTLDNMERFGASVNYCAQRPESLRIPVAKKLGRRAQKRHYCSRSLEKLLSGSASNRRRWLRIVKQSVENYQRDGSRQSLLTSFLARQSS